MRSPIARLSLVAASLTVAFAGAACGGALRGGNTDAPVVIFTNESLDMTTVFAARAGGSARRLTSVMAGRTDTLRLPADIASASSVTILAGSATGTPSASTGAISISPGLWLAIRLNPSGTQLSVLPVGVP